MARELRSSLCVLLVGCLLTNAFCAPSLPASRSRREQYRHYREDFDENSNDLAPSGSRASSTSSPFDDDDDDDDFAPMQTSSGGGSNILSLLNLATALFPSSSSGSGANKAIRNMIRQYLLRHQQPVDIRRHDESKNDTDINDVEDLTPPFQRQEDDEHDDSDSHGDDDDEDDDDSESEEHNDAAEESVEHNKEEENDKSSKQGSNSDNDNASGSDNGSDYSDEPEGDGQGGGILGLLAGLSGGEEGSDLGTLLSTVSQIVGNLSGDGFDLNALLGSAFGLFVGLLSQGEENPGTVIASYLLTSLDTITGGTAQNNGAFFGNFLSTLVKGVSAGSSASSSGQSTDHPVSPLWTLKMDILRALLQFGTSILGLASSSSTHASTL